VIFGVSEYDPESSMMRRPWPIGGCCAMVKKKEEKNIRSHQDAKNPDVSADHF
jgi:hypothetical protein